MQYIIDFLHNRVLITSISAWAIAQIIKTIIDLCFNKKVNFERLIGSGGMPSCHSSTVTALATISGFVYGVKSFEFAISCIIAIIVMYDARGVRRETGNQAVLLNQIMDYFRNMDKSQPKIEFNQNKLKELIGHTPLQVLIGSILGFIIAIIMYQILPA